MIHGLSIIRNKLESIVSVHKNNSNQTGISNSTPTQITFSTKEYDLNSEFDTVTNRYIPKRAGYYLLVAAMRCITPATAHVIYIKKNGTAITDYAAYGSGPYATAACSKIVFMNGTTDYIECVCYITAANATLSGAVEHTYFQAIKL